MMYDDPTVAVDIAYVITHLTDSLTVEPYTVSQGGPIEVHQGQIRMYAMLRVQGLYSAKLYDSNP
jgi:hypothetical protein